MKSAIVALCIFACAYAAVSDQDSQVLDNSYNVNSDGSYSYSYETDNGIKGQASAQLKAVSKDEVALEVTGSNQYKSLDGETFVVTYIANENGYQPQGAHLPTPPAPVPIPDYILRALEYIKTHPYEEKKL